MNELHHGRQVVTLVAPVAQGTAHQQQQGRPQTLATGSHDVLRNLADQRNVGLQAAFNHRVHFAHVVGNQGKGSSSA